jgi:p-hydroxybenzoate 3-monooxygenase
VAGRGRTQVGIVGGGPAGLLLSHLLHLEGIESVVLEARSREHVIHRVRAGVLEQATVELLTEAGLGQRLAREGLVHHGIELRWDGASHRVPLTELTGRSIWIYGQQKVVEDLIEARLAASGTVLFEVEGVDVSGIDGARPTLRYRHAGGACELVCDFVAGCDGFHGISRGAIPQGALRVFQSDYPFAWLGVLADVAPSTEELIYASHERGFALHSLRSPSISRLYLQVEPDTDLADWPDARIWDELRLRLAKDGFTLRDGPVLEKNVATMRSFVVEPMQHGRLFLAGDAAHIVPATGAKGLNLAVHDVRILARALARFYRTGSTRLLDGYSAVCLKRAWRVQDFSAWMSTMLHRLPGSDGFLGRLQRAQREYACRSEAGARALAENYVGLPHELD